MIPELADRFFSPISHQGNAPPLNFLKVFKKHSFYLFIYLLKDNWFTELLFSVKPQHESAIGIHISSPRKSTSHI